jgi:hypothetical protein
MSLSTMIGEMRGCVSNYSAGLARIHLKNAWTDIRNLKGWSFQLGNTGYTVPGLVNAGSVTTTLGSPTVVGDATAAAAWAVASNPTSLITQRQFRTGQGTIYNIIAYDGVDTLTLDRPWIDAYYLGPTLGYSIYQPYIVAPAQSLQAWEYFMDVRNVIHLDVNNTRGLWEQINEADPQRQIFSNPGNLIPHGVDNRTGSATYGYPMFELYPQPQSIYVYSVGYSWAGPDLTDDPALSAVPYPMTEHVVKTLARVKAYEQAEANKTADNPRGAGADYRFLMDAALKEYQAQIKEIRMLDRDIYDAWKYQMQRYTNIGVVATFSPSTGTVQSRNM